MAGLMDYRIENKYFVYEDEIAFLKNRLKEIMQIDPHSEDGAYLVRSLYFDDMDDNAYRKIAAGVDQRSKFRIRTYNNDDSHILLEEKSKRKGFTHKESALISKDTVKEMIGSDSIFNTSKAACSLKDRDDFLFKRLYCNMNTMLLHPVTIVEYERAAYIEKAGNVRITFDTNIGAGTSVSRFFDKNILSVPVLKTGMHIMEIKYDEILPEYIKSAIDIGNLKKCSFSKYYYARNAFDALTSQEEY